MRRQIIGLFLIVILIIPSVACANQPTNNSPIPANAPSNLFSDAKSDNVSASTDLVAHGPDAVFNVDDLAQNPERFTGQLRVVGVVASVAASQHTIGIIDSREYAECKVTTCSSFILPIQWTGPMPKVEDTIQVTGRIEKSGGKFIFVAKLMESTVELTGSPK